MTRGQVGTVLRRIQDLIDSTNAEDLTDGDLVLRFVQYRDEVAFTVLVRRHGGLVLNVCRHVLRHEADAEDAFQATFLILARQAASIRKRPSIACWLHGVAFRTAMNFRKSAMRRQRHEQQVEEGRSPESPVSQAALRELQALLDEEIQGMAERYRAPFVLCCLQGKSRSEVAQALGWKEGTVSSRLAKARKLLQGRLTARGVTLTSALCATALSQSETSAAVATSLATETIRAALTFASGNAAGAVSSHVVAVAEEVLRGMFMAKLKSGLAMAVVVLLGVVTAGAMVAQQETAQKVDEPNRPITAAQVADQSKKGKKARTDLRGDPLPEGVVARIGTERFRHQGDAWAVTFSPDGKLVAATSFMHGQIHLWDATTGKEVRRLEVRNGHAFAIDFSPDGNFLASRWTDQTVRIWEIATGKETVQITVNEREPREHGKVCFTPDGKAVVVESWDVVGGRVGSRLSFFDSTSGKELGTWNRPGPIGSFAISPGGKSLAVTVYGDKPAVEIWDRTNWMKLHSVPGERSHVLTFSADGRMLASAGKNPIVVSDVGTGKVLAQLDAPAFDHVMGLAFTPDDKTLISADQSGKVTFWDLATKKMRFERDARMWMIRSLALSRDGKTAAVGTVYNAIRLWDVASGRELFGGSADPDVPINSITFSPDGTLLATGGDNRHICLWDVASGRPRLRFDSPNSAHSVAFSPDGKLLATAWPNSKIARLWDVATGQIATELKHDGIGAKCVVFSPDGQTVITAHSNLWHSAIRPTSLNVWSVKDGKHLREYPLQTASIESIASAPDGKILAIATGNGTVHLWDILAGKEISRLTGHKHTVGSVAFSPDGRVLASGSKCNGSA